MFRRPINTLKRHNDTNILYPRCNGFRRLPREVLKAILDQLECDDLNNVIALLPGSTTSAPWFVEYMRTWLLKWVQKYSRCSAPSTVPDMLALTHLEVSRNQLNALPPQIGALTALTHLNVSGNQLNALPPQIDALTALTHLYVSYNHLSALPPEIGALMALKHLFVFDNQLSALPPEIGALTALTYLDVSDNQLTDQSPQIVALRARGVNVDV